MAKTAAVMPDKKLLAMHAKRAKGHGVAPFIAECRKKNLGFRPELKAYDFAATPELLASAVILFLDACRTHDEVVGVLAGIHKKVGKLDLALTGDDLRLICEIALAQGIHYTLYLHVLLPLVEKWLKTNDGDAKLAQRITQLREAYTRMRRKNDELKLVTRLEAVEKQLA